MKQLAPWLRTEPGKTALVLILLCVAVLFADLGGAHLQSPDEGRYTEAAREMLESGDWLVPRFAYMERVNKPPLTYWVIASAFRLFGASETAARLGPAVAGALTAGVLFLLGASLFGIEAGAASAIVLLTCAWYVAVARAAVTDMFLCFFVMLALAAFYRAYRTGSWASYMLFFAAAAGATLVKGPLGLGLPLLIAAVYLTLVRGWRQVAWGKIALGLLLYLAVASPWFLAVQGRYPGFLRYTFLSENLQRFAGKYHREPFYYYVPVLLLGVSTWLLPLAAAIRADGRALGRTPSRLIQESGTLFAWVWFAVTLLFFSMSKAKLLTYVIPCFPPLALIIGKHWAGAFRAREQPEAEPEQRMVTAGTAALLGLLMLGALVFGFVLKSSHWTDAQRVSAGIWIAGTSAAAVLACILGLRRGSSRAQFCGMAAAALLFVVGAEQAVKLLYQSEDIAPMGEYAAAHAGPDGRILMFRTEKMTAFRFYLGRALGSARRIEDLPPLRAEEIYAETEEPAERGERRGALADDFMAVVRAAPRGFCLMRKSDVGRFRERLAAAGWDQMPLENRKYVLVTKEPRR